MLDKDFEKPRARSSVFLNHILYIATSIIALWIGLPAQADHLREASSQKLLTGKTSEEFARVLPGAPVLRPSDLAGLNGSGANKTLK